MSSFGRRFGAIFAAAMAVLVGMSLFAAPASAKKAPKGFFGVVTQGPLGTTDYNLMGNADVGTLRFVVSWSQVQPQPGPCTSTGGACSWAHVDAIVGNAAARGVSVLPTLYGSAKFVNGNERKPPLTKAGRAGWRQFTNAFTGRYGPSGAYWNGPFQASHPGVRTRPVRSVQIWNEPSSRAFFVPKPNAKKYMKLVKVSKQGVKKASKKVKIVLGGIFGDPAKHNVPPAKYLRQIYKTKKAKKQFDAVALHPYSKNTKGLKVVAKQINQTRKAMKRGGDKKAKLWITEFGWASGGPKKLGNVTTKKGQAKMLTKSFKLMIKKRKKWRLAGATWFAWQDTKQGGACGFCRFSGLVTDARQPKPAYRAFKKIAR